MFHPQYIDCARALTRSNDPAAFTSALVKMARWTAGFDYGDLGRLIGELRTANAQEESPVQFKLLDATGKAV